MNSGKGKFDALTKKLLELGTEEATGEHGDQTTAEGYYVRELTDDDNTALGGELGEGKMWADVDGTVGAVDDTTPPEVPRTLTPAQFHFAITDAEEAIIEGFIAAIPDDATKRMAEVWWKHTTAFDRDNPFLLQMAEQITAAGIADFSPGRLDAIWLAGKQGAL